MATRWTIYKIESPTGRIYIGKAKNFNNRMSKYKKGADPKQYVIHRSIIKHGWDSHTVSKIDQFEGSDFEAGSREMFWIRSYMSNVYKYPEMNGMNLTDGGSGTKGRKCSQKTKDLMSLKMKGKKHSDETKLKLSIANKGFKRPQSAIDSHRAKMKGRKRSDEFCKNVSLGKTGKGNPKLIGRKTPQYVRDKIAESNRGRKITEEQRKKMSDAKKGKKSNNVKPVFRYDINGNFIMKHESVRDAARCISAHVSNIHDVLSGRYKHCKHFKFKYAA